MLPSSNLGSLGDSARLGYGDSDLQGFDNGVRGSGRPTFAEATSWYA
jgi:hypothetical protein